MTEKKSLFKPMKYTAKPKVVLLYGAPGVGKTSLLTSLDSTQFGKVLLIDCDHGTGRVVPEGVATTEPVTSISDLEQIRRELVKGVEGYDTLIFDGLGPVLEWAREKVCGSTGSMMDTGKMSQKTWPERNIIVMNVFMQFSRMPFNQIFFTAGHQIDGGGDSGRPMRVIPMLSESLGSKMAHYLDYVFYMEAAGAKRFLRIGHSAQHLTRNRNPEIDKKYGGRIELAPAGVEQKKFIELLGDM